ncbi:MAG: tripartite tricarboxylate transporter substrate binding protein [Lawsonibacter sp.]|nr:tripartite tricarboxylate transporter substrate binding protein [Lawsonibacter sp.]
MKATKKLASLALAAALALGLAGCGNSSAPPAQPSPAPGASPAQSGAPAADYSGWPEKDITVIYYTKAGSGGDIFLRQLASALDGKLNGHKLLIENLVDPTGATAWSKVQRSAADGYTLACLSSTVVTADIIGGSPVKYAGFDYVIGMGMDPQYIYCKADAPYNNLEELMDYCKANPGQLSWATAAPTSASTICSVALINKAGVEVNRVVYETGSDSLVAVLGGFVDVAVGEYGDMAAQVDAGELKLLCLLSKERNALDVPTTLEQGYDFIFERPRGIAAPEGTDPALAERIYEVFAQAYESEEFMAYLESVAIDPVLQTGDEFLNSYDAIAATVNDNMAALTGQAG